MTLFGHKDRDQPPTELIIQQPIPSTPPSLGDGVAITVLNTANGPVLSTAHGIIQTADQTAFGSRETIRIINVLNGVINGISDKVDILWNRPDRSFAEVEWQPCTITVTAAGGIDATEIDGAVHLRGGLSTNTFRTSVSTGSFLAVGKLPDGMTRPEVPALVPVWAILTGSTYRIAVVRLGTDGVLSVAGPTGSIDGFDVTGVAIPACGVGARSVGEEDLDAIAAVKPGEEPETGNELQKLMEAISGSGATPETVQETLWKLNDVLEALMKASGVELA